MATSNLIPFLEKVDQDTALLERLNALSSGTQEEARAQFLAISGEIGLPLTEEDLQTLRRLSSGELSESELGAVAGGVDFAAVNAWFAKIEKRLITHYLA